MTSAAQAELVAVSGDATCEAALKEALSAFTPADRSGFRSVHVDTSKIVVEGDTAAAAPGAVTYSDGVADVLRFHREIDLTRVSGAWLLNSVVEADLNH